MLAVGLPRCPHEQCAPDPGHYSRDLQDRNDIFGLNSLAARSKPYNQTIQRRLDGKFSLHRFTTQQYHPRTYLLTDGNCVRPDATSNRSSHLMLGHSSALKRLKDASAAIQP